MTTRRPSRWAIRRQGEILGHLVRHPWATTEDIAERYKRHPDQVRGDLNDLAYAGEVDARKTTVPGLLGRRYIVTVWNLAKKDPAQDPAPSYTDTFHDPALTRRNPDA